MLLTQFSHPFLFLLTARIAITTKIIITTSSNPPTTPAIMPYRKSRGASELKSAIYCTLLVGYNIFICKLAIIGLSGQLLYPRLRY